MAALRIILAGCLAAVVLGKPLDQLYKNEKFRLYTDTNAGDVNQHTLNVEGSRALIFKVRACRSARLSMAAVYQHSSTTTDLTIGAEGNTMTTLTYLGTGEEVASEETPDVLHCGEMRAFWVSWAYGYFRFGRGSALGVGMLMEFQKTGDLNHDVTAIKFLTDDGIAGVWEVEQDQFFTMAAQPPSLTGTPFPAMTWRTVQYEPGNFYYFSVKACKDISIYFGDSFGDAQYTIQIAHNGRNSVLRGGEQLGEDEPYTLDCDVPHMFWVSWWMDRIILGSGVIKYQNYLLDINETAVGDIYSLGFAAGPDAQAVFDFAATIDEQYTFHTSIKSSSISNPDYQHWLHAAEGSFVAFSVQACKDVQVVLSDTIGSVSSNAVILQLNYQGSTTRLVSASGAVLATAQNGDILSCNVMTQIWISFNDNAFRAGTGTVKGIGTFLGATPDLDVRMTAVGFSSQDDTPAQWAVATIEPGVLRVTTEANMDLEYNTWASGTKRYYKEFTLDQCSGTAVISITPCLGCERMGATGSFHINITSNNVKLALLGRFQDETLDEYNGVVTQCGEQLSFFVSWYEGIFLFGKGDLSSGETLVTMTEPLPYAGDAIALRSDTKCTWEWTMETGEQLSFQQRERDLNYSWVRVSPVLQWQRFWITAADIKIHLSPTYGDNTTGYAFRFTNNQITCHRNTEETIGDSHSLTLDKYHRRLMVISWQDGLISIGPETGGDPYISYQDNSPMSIIGIGILPQGDSSEVRMPHTFASEMAFITTASRSQLENWMDLMHHDTLVFTARSAHSAEIVLAPFMYHDAVDNFYRLVIGSASNQITTIMQDDQVVAQVDTPDILSSSEDRTFWIQWYHGEIVFGRGKHIGNDVVIAYYDPSPSPITAAAFTGNGQQVTWTVGLVPYGNLLGLEDMSTGSGGLSGGAVAGIVIGVLILVAVIGGFGFMYQTGRLGVVGGPRPSGNGLGPRSANGPQQFDNPISYGDTNAVPSAQTQA